MLDMTLSERGYIGAVLQGKTRVTDSGLTAEMFSLPTCSRIFADAQRLEAQGKTADLATVCMMDDSVTEEAIEIMQEASATLSLVAQHADNIRMAAMRREVIRRCSEAVNAATDGEVPISDTISRLRTALDAISAGINTGGYVSGTDAMLDLWAYMEGKLIEPTIPTGLTGLDKRLNGGIGGGKLVVIGARPSVGKSAFMSMMAVNAIKQGKRVLIDSLEMPVRENAMRMMAQESGVTVGNMERRELEANDWERMAESLALMPGDNYRFTTSASTLSALRTEALRMRADVGLDMIVVDYLQLMNPTGKSAGRRVEAIGEISRGLKLLALELKIPIVVGAQVNRQSAQGEESRAPKLSELRESGSIEQDADLVFMLHAPNLESMSRDLIIAKNRQGRLGVTSLVFNGELMRFIELKKE